MQEKMTKSSMYFIKATYNPDSPIIILSPLRSRWSFPISFTQKEFLSAINRTSSSTSFVESHWLEP